MVLQLRHCAIVPALLREWRQIKVVLHVLMQLIMLWDFARMALMNVLTRQGAPSILEHALTVPLSLPKPMCRGALRQSLIWNRVMLWSSGMLPCSPFLRRNSWNLEMYALTIIAVGLLRTCVPQIQI